MSDSAELAALRRRVLDMALGAMGYHPFDAASQSWMSSCDCSSLKCWHRFCVAVEREFDLYGKVRHDIWLGSLDAIVAALYAAGVRA